VTTHDIRQGLEEVRRALSPCLRPESHDAIQEALSNTYGTGAAGYVIHPDNPLAFKAVYNQELGCTVWVDLYCDIRWSADGSLLPLQQDLKMRVWSPWDSTSGSGASQAFLHEREREALTKRSRNTHDRLILAEIDRAKYRGSRVVHRCHYDRANVDERGRPQPGPRYHLQFGGATRDDEFPWLRRVLSLPRLPAPPIDAIIACDLIAANFYPDLHSELVEDPHWRGVVKKSERILRAYYQRSIDVMEEGGCVLHYWDHPRLCEAEGLTPPAAP